ncbi:MAG: carbohydrate-binding family 9-like protein [Planctomycetota bacterium]|nr:carbohydrate-binding family 9-like protein [Planctomycetota bacterium]
MTAPIVDGHLNDSAWLKTDWTPDFVDIQGPHLPTPRFQTRVKMCWDEQFFYIAADMEEPHVWATLTQHDSVIFHDNDFEVFIDPDGDREQYYEIEINALGTEWDLRLVKTYIDGGPPVDSWEIPGLQKAVAVQGTLNDPSDLDRGWTVELGIPWVVLAEFANRPSPPNYGDSWRVNFSRVEWQETHAHGEYKKIPDTKEDNWVWTPQHTINMHLPEHWGFVRFVK